MSEVVVVASLVALPGKESAVEEFLLDLLAPTHGADGCLLYALHQGADDPRQFAMVERWTSREAANRHMESETIQKALARIDELFSEPPQISFYEPIPGGVSEKGSLARNRP